MTYKIPKKQIKEKQIYNLEIEKKINQDKINNTLFENKQEDTEPRLLTIIIEKSKEHHLQFFKSKTEFRVSGRWFDKKHHKFEEKNAEIEVLFYDNKNQTKSKDLMNYLKAYNKKYIKEKLLYVRITPIVKTSIPK